MTSSSYGPAQQEYCATYYELWQRLTTDEEAISLD